MNTNEVTNLEMNEETSAYWNMHVADCCFPCTTRETTTYWNMHVADCCFPCTTRILALGFAMASIINIIFSTIGLVETSHNKLQEQCPDTNIWIYLIGTIIISCGACNNVQLAIGDETSRRTALYGIIPMIGWLLWGVYELWGVDCVNEIDDTIIYRMLEINVIALLVFTGLLFMFIVSACIASKLDLCVYRLPR